MPEQKAQLPIITIPVLDIVRLVTSYFVENANICTVRLPAAKVEGQVFDLLSLTLVKIL